jgi:hypothetical protein
MGDMRNAYKIFVGKLKGKRPLETPRCRWVDNIRVALGEIGWKGVDWMHVTQDMGKWRSLVNTVMDLWVS